ncbi:MAG TPA: TlpA disulfide reductase family protein [Candidatus Acidoferrales bacterium]|nr:TlpA disulfide reductase family protein [Candidatus Acidoferrales bacterium]
MNRAERRRTAPTTKAKAKGKSRGWMIYGSIALVVIGLIVAVAVASYVPPPPAPPDAVTLTPGQVAPEFQVSTTAGPFDLAQEKGKPVFLEVFATWCPHCQRETAILNKLYAAYNGRVAFVAVTGNPLGMDRTSPESQGDVNNFVAQFNVQYPVAYDANLDVARKYFQGGYPTLVVIGKTGLIQTVGTGELTQAKLSGYLDKALTAPG